MKYIKNFFYFLSGEPKSGNVIKCIQKGWFLPFAVLALGINLIRKGLFAEHSLLLMFISLMSTMFLWQMGWMMSLNRFFLINGKKGLKSRKDIQEKIKIIPFIIKITVSLILFLIAYLMTKVYIIQIIVIIIASFIAWSAGWGMSYSVKNKN